MRTFRLNLTVTILAFLSGLLILTWLLFSLLAFKTAANDLYAQKGEHARMLLATFVNQLPDAIPVYPYSLLPTNESAAIYAQKLSEEASFIRLTLLDVNGKPVFTVARESGGDLFQPFTGTGQLREGSFVSADGASIICTSRIARGEQVAVAPVWCFRWPPKRPVWNAHARCSWLILPSISSSCSAWAHSFCPVSW